MCERSNLCGVNVIFLLTFCSATCTLLLLLVDSQSNFNHSRHWFFFVCWCCTFQRTGSDYDWQPCKPMTGQRKVSCTLSLSWWLVDITRFLENGGGTVVKHGWMHFLGCVYMDLFFLTSNLRTIITKFVNYLYIRYKHKDWRLNDDSAVLLIQITCHFFSLSSQFVRYACYGYLASYL